MKNVDIRASIGLSFVGLCGLLSLIFPASYEPGVVQACPLVAVGVGLAAVSLVSGFMASRKAEKAAKREQQRREQLLARIKKAASPENFKKILNTLRPIFREAAIQNIAPAVESTVATQLGRRDLTGTGLGQTLTSMAPAVAGVQGLNLATDQAGVMQGNQINSLAMGLGAGAGTLAQIDGFNPVGQAAGQTAQLISDIRGIPGLTQQPQGGQAFLNNTINQPGLGANQPLLTPGGQPPAPLLPYQANQFYDPNNPSQFR